MKKLILIVGLTAALSAPAFAATNLVVNGTFNGPSGWSSADTVETNPSWVYGLSQVNATDTNLEVLGNTSPDSVYQDVTGLVMGHSYTLSYLYGGRSGADASMTTSFGGATIVGSAISGNLGVWVGQSFNIIATGATERLQFTAIALNGCPSCGAEVTNVSVTGVPEVSTWAMMLAGFAGLGFVGYRRQKAVQA
jgi:hypothetical protein